VTRTAAIGALLGVVAILIRLPFFAHQLWAWDSVLYARAIEQGFHVDYDLSGQRPHPPGYLFYVAAAALFRLFVANSNAALVLVSVLAGALATVAIFLFARRLASEPAALAAAAAFAVNPLVWAYSEVSYPYTVLALGSVLVAALCHAARGGTARTVLATSAVFGLATGFRQDLLLLLGPAWLWALAAHRWRVRAAAVALLALASFVWLVPTVILSEGPEAYALALSTQIEFVRTTYSVPQHGLKALFANLGTTAYAMGWGLMLVGTLAPLALGARRMRAFLLLWSAPAIAFYVIVHIGEWGYTLSILPALYVASAIGLDLVGRIRCVPRSAWRASGTVAALLPAAVFVFTPAPFSAAAIETHDRELASRVVYVRQNFAPDATAVLAREDFLLVRYYLSEYRAWLYDPEPHAKAKARQRKRMGNVTSVVVFTRGLRPLSDHAVRYLECGRGVKIAYLPVLPGEVLELSGELYFTSREP
jgi:4-amino-4-deoxy-L-arabinose transferase-like glycosyltransferase